MHATLTLQELLEFYADIGVDEAIAPDPVSKIQEIQQKPDAEPVILSPAPSQASPLALSENPSVGEAKLLANRAQTLSELKSALESFQGLSLKRTATQMVFDDGHPHARIMIIGEAPGADEDRVGRPFVGVSGQLLDKMFAAIGLSREQHLYITNVIHWRPPGNRAPAEDEIALSLPFVQRHIELVAPAIIVVTGGVAAKTLLQTAQGILRLRGRWTEYVSESLKQPIPLLPMLHPAYLLRAPAQKALAWADLVALKKKIQDLQLKI